MSESETKASTNAVVLPQKMRASLRHARRWLRVETLLRVGASLLALVGIVALPLLYIGARLQLARGFSLGLLGGVGTIALVVLVREGLRLHRVQKNRALAQLLQRAQPRLGDRVLTSIELAGAIPLGSSEVLVRAHIERTESLLRSHNVRPLLRRQLWLRLRTHLYVGTIGAVIACGLFFVSAKTLNQALRAIVHVDKSDVGARLLPPLVTDISLHYLYPAYLKREPRLIEGSTGDIVAPRGTRVIIEGKADRDIDAALLTMGSERLRMLVDPPRRVRGEITITDEMQYRFVLQKGTVELSEHNGHSIRVEIDTAPNVQLVAPKQDQVVRELDVVDIEFEARDDHGLGQAQLVVQRLGAAEPYRRVVDDGKGTAPALATKFTLDVSVLEAQPGERFVLSVEVEDNDTVSGPKRASSELRVLKVFSAYEHHEEQLQKLNKVFDLLVVALADELENPFEPDPKDAVRKQQLDKAQAIGIAAHDVLLVLADTIRGFDDDELARAELRRALRYIYDELKGLDGKYSSVLQALSSIYEASGSYQIGYARRYQQGQTQRVKSLERHILYLEDLLNRERLEAARLAAKELSQVQNELAQLLTQYKNSGDEATRKKILAQLMRLRDKVAELTQRLARLRRDVSDEYINPEALADRNFPEQLDTLTHMVNEGRIDEAIAELERLRQATGQLQDDMQRSQQEYGGEAYAELRRQFSELQAEIEELETTQRHLAEENERRYQAATKALRKAHKVNLKAMARRLARKVRDIVDELDHIDPEQLQSYEARGLAEAHERLDETARALDTQDVEAAWQSAENALSGLNGLHSELQRRASYWPEEAKQLSAMLRQTASTQQQTERVVDELSQLFANPRTIKDAATLKAMQHQARTQRQLAKRTQQAHAQLDALAKQAPVLGPSHSRLLDEAGSEMQEAAQQLKGRAMAGAAQHQREALSKLAELKRAMAQQSQSGTQGMPMPWGGVAGRGEGLMGDRSDERVEIPKAASTQAPAAFRREILEAMREPAPEGFREEVRHYYEELVR